MIRKRSKRSRLRGRKTCGYGARKKHRGSGSRGGKGMAGMALCKRPSMMKYAPDYYGRSGFKSLQQKKSKKLCYLNLDDINRKIHDFENKKLVSKTAEGTEINLEGYKILGSGHLRGKFIIKASAFSENAKQKIESEGGKAVQM